VAFCVLLLFDLKVLASHAWDPRVFILDRPADLPTGQTWGVGYDGQFSYYLAVNPWGSTLGLDQVNYRYQRILFPILVKGLSLGQAALVPWMMLAVNLVSASVGCALLGTLLAAREASPWLALVWVFSIGYLLAMRMDLVEPLALALALGGWVAFERQKTGVAIVLFALGALTKEIALLFPAALVVDTLMRHKGRLALGLFVGSFGPYILLFLLLAYVFGISDKAAEQSRLLLIPFYGVKYISTLPSLIVTSLWTLLPAIGFGLWAAWDVFQKRFASAHLPDSLLVLFQVGLIATLPVLTWEDPLALLRFALGLIAGVLLWAASHHPRVLPFIFALWFWSGLILFFVPGMM
jgi:hypothetical protein